MIILDEKSEYETISFLCQGYTLKLNIATATHCTVTCLLKIATVNHLKKYTERAIISENNHNKPVKVFFFFFFKVLPFFQEHLSSGT